MVYFIQQLSSSVAEIGSRSGLSNFPISHLLCFTLHCYSFFIRKYRLKIAMQNFKNIVLIIKNSIIVH